MSMMRRAAIDRPRRPRENGGRAWRKNAFSFLFFLPLLRNNRSRELLILVKRLSEGRRCEWRREFVRVLARDLLRNKRDVSDIVSLHWQ